MSGTKITLATGAYRQVRGKVDAEFSEIGEQNLKNITTPHRVYRVRSGSPAEAARTLAATLLRTDKPSIGVLPFANLSDDPEQEYLVSCRDGRGDHHRA